MSKEKRRIFGGKGDRPECSLPKSLCHGTIATAGLWHSKSCLQGEALCGKAVPQFLQFVQTLWYNSYSKAVAFKELVCRAASQFVWNV